MKYTRIILSVLIFGVMAVGLGSSSAQADTSPKTCLNLASNIRQGMSDSRTDGDISRLQDFLAGEGHFDRAHSGTLHFGRLTLAAVMRFQSAHNLPITGFVGPMTRDLIRSMTCGTTTNTPVTIYAMNPLNGSTGTTVSLTGFGFTSDNTVLMDGNVAARNVPITSSIAIACTTNPGCHGGINQTITFTVPSSIAPNCPAHAMCPMYMRLVTPGTYAITVQNSNGTSNSFNFVVTGTSPNGPLSIQGLDAPATLSLGQSGTWTVHVSVPNTSGNLHYTVLWGDEATYGAAMILTPQPVTENASATFTHSYQRTGTVTPQFTVSDDYGHTVSTSATVNITSL